jgi:hypothetical protein
MYYLVGAATGKYSVTPPKLTTFLINLYTYPYIGKPFYRDFPSIVFFFFFFLEYLITDNIFKIDTILEEPGAELSWTVI